MKALVCVLFAASALCAADANVAGRWSGNGTMTLPNGETRDTPVVMLVKQNGTEVTGTIGPGDDEQHPIQNAKIQGGKLTMEVATDNGTFKLDLVVTGDKIAGNGTAGQEGQTTKVKVELTRAK